VIDEALKNAEKQYQRQLDALAKTMQDKLATIEKSMNEMVAQIVKQTYASLLSADSPLVSKGDHQLLHSEVTGLNTKMDAIMALLQNRTTSIESPPRPKKQDNKSTPKRGLLTQYFAPSSTSTQDSEMLVSED
jgi:predicted ribosome quality control (RQC) complex YloA/Tae2 family protein